MSDDETDGIIQGSLRNELGKDVTLLTVAHRLRTVMDADKIVSRSILMRKNVTSSPLNDSWFSTLVPW